MIFFLFIVASKNSDDLIWEPIVDGAFWQENMGTGFGWCILTIGYGNLFLMLHFDKKIWEPIVDGAFCSHCVSFCP